MNTTTKIVLAAFIGILVGAGGAIAFNKPEQMASNGHMDGKMDMTGMMAAMNAELSGKQGDEFDKAFLSEMTLHHQGAIEMAQLALQNAKHDEIRKLAKDIISAQEAEINQMRDWQTNWYGSQAPMTSGENAESGSAVHHAQ